MKNKTKYARFVLAAFLYIVSSGCTPSNDSLLDEKKYDQILNEFTRLRLEYQLFSEETPTNLYLLDSLAANHQVNIDELMRQIKQKNPEFYDALTENR